MKKIFIVLLFTLPLALQPMQKHRKGRSRRINVTARSLGLTPSRPLQVFPSLTVTQSHEQNAPEIISTAPNGHQEASLISLEKLDTLIIDFDVQTMISKDIDVLEAQAAQFYLQFQHRSSCDRAPANQCHDISIIIKALYQEEKIQANLLAINPLLTKKRIQSFTSATKGSHFATMLLQSISRQEGLTTILYTMLNNCTSEILFLSAQYQLNIESISQSFYSLNSQDSTTPKYFENFTICLLKALQEHSELSIIAKILNHENCSLKNKTGILEFFTVRYATLTQRITLELSRLRDLEYGLVKKSYHAAREYNQIINHSCFGKASIRGLLSTHKTIMDAQLSFRKILSLLFLLQTPSKNVEHILRLKSLIYVCQSLLDEYSVRLESALNDVTHDSRSVPLLHCIRGLLAYMQEDKGDAYYIQALNDFLDNAPLNNEFALEESNTIQRSIIDELMSLKKKVEKDKVIDPTNLMQSLNINRNLVNKKIRTRYCDLIIAMKKSRTFSVTPEMMTLINI